MFFVLIFLGTSGRGFNEAVIMWKNRRESPVRMLLIAVAHLLLCALASAAPGAKEPRRASLLHGATSDGMQECFAPFLHRQVEYHLEANAAWGFGSHVAKDSTNVSATVLVSTQLAAGRDKLSWVHTLEVVRLWRTKSYAAAGSPQTVTASMPDDSARFRIRIFQRECNALDDIIHSPDVSPQEVDFARGLANMIVFALPSGTDLGNRFGMTILVTVIAQHSCPNILAST